MEKMMSLWNKHAKCELINRDMTVDELAAAIGRSREYTSAVVNGRIKAEPAIKAISDVLNIPEAGITSTGNLIISRKCGGEHGKEPYKRE